MSMVGVRRVSLAYLAHTNEDPEYGDNPPSLLAFRAHCTEFGFLEKDLIQHFHHDHFLYEHNNGIFFDKLEISLAHYSYMAIISRFSKNRNGRGLLLVLK